MENLNPGPGVAVVVPWAGAASMVAASKPYKPIKESAKEDSLDRQEPMIPVASWR